MSASRCSTIILYIVSNSKPVVMSKTKSVLTAATWGLGDWVCVLVFLRGNVSIDAFGETLYLVLVVVS